MSSVPASKKSNAQDSRPSAADLEKVRDILFGEETRDLRQELDNLREEVRELRVQLEEARKELGERIAAESAGSGAEIDKVADSVAQLRDDKLSRAQFAEMLSKMAGEVREES